MIGKVLENLGNFSARCTARFNDHVRHTKFENGINFMSQRRVKDSKLRFAILIKAGSFDDPEGKEGIAHFLEHTFFDDNTRQEFRKRKGYVGAYTGADRIAIHGEIENTPENKDFITSELSRMLTENVEENVFTKEKRRVLNEIGIYQDQAEHVHRSLLRKAFSSERGNFNILGDKEMVRSIDISDLNEFKHKWFTGQNIYIAFSGVSDHAKIHNDFERKLINLPAQKPPPHFVSKWNPVDYRQKNDSTHQSYFSINFPVPALSQEKYYVSQFAALYLNRMVCEELRDKKGLVYDVAAWNITTFDRPGFCFIQGNALPEDAGEILPTVTEILANAAARIDENRLGVIKENWIDEYKDRKNIGLTAHSPDSMIDDVACWGRIVPVNECEQAYKAITAEQVREFIQTTLDQPPAIIAYGDHSKLHSYEEFQSMLAQKRIEAHEFTALAAEIS